MATGRLVGQALHNDAHAAAWSAYGMPPVAAICADYPPGSAYSVGPLSCHPLWAVPHTGFCAVNAVLQSLQSLCIGAGSPQPGDAHHQRQWHCLKATASCLEEKLPQPCDVLAGPGHTSGVSRILVSTGSKPGIKSADRCMQQHGQQFAWFTYGARVQPKPHPRWSCNAVRMRMHTA